MSAYTPNTEHVKHYYVLGVRTAFVAPRSEHEQEFDRWLAAHDAEVIRQYRIEDYRKRAASADAAWKEYGDVNDCTERDHYLEMARELEEEK